MFCKGIIFKNYICAYIYVYIHVCVIIYMLFNLLAISNLYLPKYEILSSLYVFLLYLLSV